MMSIPLLLGYLVVIAVYLTGCLIIHLRDSHDDKHRDKDSRAKRSTPRDGGAHAIHL
jgi:hypothetical protein